MGRANCSCTNDDLPPRLRHIAEVGLARVHRLKVHSCRLECTAFRRKLDFADDRVGTDLQATLALLGKLGWEKSEECGVPVVFAVLYHVQRRDVCGRDVRSVRIWHSWDSNFLDGAVRADDSLGEVFKTEKRT